MGALFRSEEMTRCQLYLQTEASYACVAELGELGLVQFRDLNMETTAFQRKFVNEVRRCDEMERKLRFIEKEIKKDEIPMADTGENPDAPPPREMVDLEATFEKLENELREVNVNQETLKKNFLELTELKYILRKTQAFFDGQEDKSALQNLSDAAADARRQETMAENGVLTYVNPALDIGDESLDKSVEKQDRGDKPELNFVAGVILQERMHTFERLLWRACRGNVFLRQSEITEPLEDPTTGLFVRKNVFIIFFQGEQLKTRVKKICDGFRATLYPCPDSEQERHEMSIGVMTRIEDLNTVLGQTQDHRHRVLVAAAKNVVVWFAKVRKIKAVYHTLNMFNIDVTQKCLIAECWCPVADLDKIQLALKRGTEESGSTVPSILQLMESNEQPPTYFRTNKFTKGFQNIVDAYGVAGYQEVNPAPYTIITFPFLFAIMFGDAGHGTLMFLFALFLVVRERALEAQKIQDEIFQIFFSGRYILLLMGIFSIYTGSIYNDVFSLSFNVFGSGWKIPMWKNTTLIDTEKLQLDPNRTFSHPYPWGFDPIWQIAENKIAFQNSFKMKMSVIVGVFQMMFGVMLKLVNAVYFKKKLDIFFVFIPSFLFLSSIFFYLCIEIFYKWTHLGVPASGCVNGYPGPHCAPGLIIGLINMFMFNHKPRMNCSSGLDPDCGEMQFYTGQAIVEEVLVIVAVICIPWMLLVKPSIQTHMYRKHKRQIQQTSEPSVHAEMNSDEELTKSDEAAVVNISSGGGGGGGGEGGGGHGGGGHGDEEEFSIGDAFIYSSIHTIEFCLGCVSHTASYLRLWALSLAHSKLSEVLWQYVMHNAVAIVSGYGGLITVYILFAAFAVLTIAILIVMEGLSAFLHALRLHWVEFNSKFYSGDGYAFTPFSFDVILEEADAATDIK